LLLDVANGMLHQGHKTLLMPECYHSAVGQLPSRHMAAGLLRLLAVAAKDVAL